MVELILFTETMAFSTPSWGANTGRLNDCPSRYDHDHTASTYALLSDRCYCHSVSYNFFANFFGLERGSNLRPLGEVQRLNPLGHNVVADVGGIFRPRRLAFILHGMHLSCT